MGAQLDLLEYLGTSHLRATANGDRLHVRASGGEREATLDALVKAINALDREGFPALHLFGGACVWPHEVAPGTFLWRLPLRSTGEAERAAGFLTSWWASRGGA